jgi:O-antigen/teichoic acid export membrane protein
VAPTPEEIEAAAVLARANAHAAAIIGRARVDAAADRAAAQADAEAIVAMARAQARAILEALPDPTTAEPEQERDGEGQPEVASQPEVTAQPEADARPDPRAQLDEPPSDQPDELHHADPDESAGGLRARIGALRHAGWGLTDQALNSITNFGVGLAAARTSSAAEFGAFAVAFATYLIGLGIVRALIAEVYSVRYADHVDTSAGPRQRYPSVPGAWGAALLVSFAGSLACLVAALFTSGSLEASFLVLAAGLPVLVLQDVARFICITRRDAFGAALYDLAWVVGFGGSLLVVSVVDGFPGAVTTFVLWVFGAACGFVVAAVRMRALPHLRAGVQFLRGVWRYSARYTGDWLALGATVQFGYYLLGATAGLAVVGELRAVMLLIGPLNIVVAGAATLLVPELRRYYRSRGPTLRPAVLLTAFLVGVTLVWFAFMAVLPESTLRNLLGDAAADASSLLPLLFLYTMVNMAAQSPVVALRATGNARRGTKATAPVAPLVLLGASIGAWVTGDASGSLVAWTVSGAVTLVLGTWQLHRALQEPETIYGDVAGPTLDDLERAAIIEAASELDTAQPIEPSYPR